MEYVKTRLPPSRNPPRLFTSLGGCEIKWCVLVEVLLLNSWTCLCWRVNTAIHQNKYSWCLCCCCFFQDIQKTIIIVNKNFSHIHKSCLHIVYWQQTRFFFFASVRLHYALCLPSGIWLGFEGRVMAHGKCYFCQQQKIRKKHCFTLISIPR